MFFFGKFRSIFSTENDFENQNLEIFGKVFIILASLTMIWFSEKMLISIILNPNFNPVTLSK